MSNLKNDIVLSNTKEASVKYPLIILTMKEMALILLSEELLESIAFPSLSCLLGYSLRMCHLHMTAYIYRCLANFLLGSREIMM